MFLYYIKETLASLFKSKLASLLIVLTTTIAIMFVTLSVGLVVFSNVINNRLKDNIQINLFISDTVSQSSMKDIESKLDQDMYIASKKFISKKEALKIMEEKTGKEFLTVLESNPLPAMFLVKLTADSLTSFNIGPIVESLKKIDGIDDVVYDYSLTLKILNFVNESKKVIYGIALFLVLLSVYLVFSNNRLLLTSRFEQFNTMKLVGAKLSTIKIPIIFNGIIMGILSAGICIAIYFLMVHFLSEIYATQIITDESYFIVGFIVLVGIVLGFLGSFLSTLNVSLKISKVRR